MIQFPNLSTIEAALARFPRYSGRYRGAWFMIELKPSGFYFSKVNGKNCFVRDNLRDVIDAVYKKIEKGEV